MNLKFRYSTLIEAVIQCASRNPFFWIDHPLLGSSLSAQMKLVPLSDRKVTSPTKKYSLYTYPKEMSHVYGLLLLLGMLTEHHSVPCFVPFWSKRVQNSPPPFVWREDCLELLALPVGPPLFVMLAYNALSCMLCIWILLCRQLYSILVSNIVVWLLQLIGFFHIIKIQKKKKFNATSTW